MGPRVEAPADRLRRPWSRSDRRVPRTVLRPLQTFLQTEASGGILLLIATVAALAWANSPWRASYASVWHTALTVDLGPWQIAHDLRHWVNDGAMSLFFLVVGLEIKRELSTGELRSPRAAAVPALAALGGMVVPALLYVSINAGGDAIGGWGVPIATDIAFALGILTLAAARAPATLKPFLLTLAIVDDIGAILVIALVYSDGLTVEALVVAAGLCLVMVAAQRVHVQAAAVYVGLGLGVWVATAVSGVHPTIAGVALGLLTPALPFQRPRAVSDAAHRIADATVDDPVPPDADAHHWLRLAQLSRETVSPLARVEEALHPWTSYVIVPVFALANAGVELTWSALRGALTSPVAIGIVVGLVVGKVVGIVAATRLATRLGLAPPPGVSGRALLGLGAVAGVGFTVALFVADLALPGAARGEAKIAILAASAIAGAAGAMILREVREEPDPPREEAR